MVIVPRPALLIVDVENDFCKPNGSLGLEGGRELATKINELLDYPGFVLKVAAKDFHPPDHVSFASNHEGAIPFLSQTTMINPENPDEQITTTLYPDHCVQGTPGCEIIEEIHQDKVDVVVLKGTHSKFESFSAFGAPFRSPPVHQTELHDLLSAHRITHLYCCGLAYNVCVFWTAVDGQRHGYQTFVLKDVTASRQSTEEKMHTEVALEHNGVRVITMVSEELDIARSPIAVS